MDQQASKLILAQTVAMVIAFVSGVHWLKWNDSAWVLLPMLGGPFVSILVGMLGSIWAESTR